MATLKSPVLAQPLQPGISPFDPRGLAGVAAIPEAKTRLLFGAFLLVLIIEYVGLSQSLPILKVTRFTTVLSALLVLRILTMVSLFELIQYVQSRLLLVFLGFTGLSVFWAYVATYAAESITPHAGYFGLFLLGMTLLDRRTRVDRLALTMIALAIFLIGRNLNQLTSGIRAGWFNAGYFLSDGNDFGWGLCIFLPFGLYLALTKRPLLIRAVGLGGASLCLFGIVGTQSRGATLAIAAAIVFYWAFMAKRKVLGVAVVAASMIAVLALAPGDYVNRMQTIQNYEEDGSAMGRIFAWKAATRMAIDHPLGVGAGNFNTAYGRIYRTDDGPVRWISAHSVYFKVLAEYGFLGVAIIIWLIVANILQNQRTRKMILREPERATLSELWPGLLNMSIVGYTVGGIFLGGIMYPHLYILSAMTLSARRITELDLASSEGANGAKKTRASLDAGPSSLGAAPPPRIQWHAGRARVRTR